MPKQFIRQASFGAGEFSPRALGRTDLPQYPAGLSQLKNFVVTPQGSATRRPGMKHIGVAKSVGAFDTVERSSATGAFDLNDVVYAAELGLWVGVGNANGTNGVIVKSSDNGLTWGAAGTIPAINEGLNGIAWSGSLFVAVGEDGATKATIFTSTDGDIWIDRSVALTGTPRLFGVFWDGGLFLAAGIQDAIIITSPDGITWAEKLTTVETGFFGISINPSSSLRIIAGLADTEIRSSSDGITWGILARPTNFTCNSVFFDSGFFYLAGQNTTGDVDGQIYRGTGDGTWASVYSNGSGSTAIQALSRFGDFLVAVGEAGLLVTSQDDGANWTTQSTIEALDLNGVAFGNGRLTIVGEDDGADAQLFQMFEDTTGRRIENFIGSTGSPYMLEFGHLYIRFWRDDIQVESSPGTPLEVATPWSGGEIKDVQFAQANDVMYLVHPNFTPRKLTRTGEVTFTITDLMDPGTVTVNRFSSTFKLWDGPYLSENGTVTTITLSGTGTGSKTATASQSLFVSTDIGRTLRVFSQVDGSLIWGWGVITAVASPTSATIFMVEDPSTTSAETRWALGAWSATTGYPAAISFYGQRLCFANTAAEPMNGWTSILASFEEFDPTTVTDAVLADNGIAFTVASREMLPIKWLEAGFDLMAGTQGGVFRIDGGPNGNQLSPQSIRVRLASGYGAAPLNPTFIGELLLYTQQAKRIVRGLSPREAQDVLALPDLTLISEHISASGIEEMVFASVPHSIVWMRRADGLLIGLTVNPATQIVAWHSHQMPGSLTGSSFPKILSMAVLPIDAHDQLWTVIRRTVNGSTVEHLEAMQLPFDSDQDDQEDAIYLDAAVLYDGPATTAISGLDHLEGESVLAYADGIEQGPFTVSSGAITLTTAASTVWTGLDYEDLSDLETLPVKSRGNESAKVRIVTTLIEVLDTNGLQVGISAATLSPLHPSLQPDTWSTGDLKPLVTGDREHLPPGDTQTRPTLLIRPVGPLPATITGLTHLINFDHV